MRLWPRKFFAVAGICTVGGTTLVKRSTDDLAVVLEIALPSQSNELDWEGGKVLLSMGYKGVFIFFSRFELK